MVVRRITSRRVRQGATARVDLTAGDLARLLRVDLKTIHNWVKQGYVGAERTEGRHLRFHRTEVVRFLRRQEHTIPREIGAPKPRVVLAGRKVPARQSVAHFAGGTVMRGILEAAGGAHEVFVLELDALASSATRELMRALRERPETRRLSVVGVSRKAARRTDFIEAGGDMALPPARSADIVRAAHYLTGRTVLPPRGALMPE